MQLSVAIGFLGKVVLLCQPEPKDVLSDALRTGGIAISATFADDGPEMCSRLPLA